MLCWKYSEIRISRVVINGVKCTNRSSSAYSDAQQYEKSPFILNRERGNNGPHGIVADDDKATDLPTLERTYAAYILRERNK